MRKLTTGLFLSLLTLYVKAESSCWSESYNYEWYNILI